MADLQEKGNRSLKAEVSEKTKEKEKKRICNSGTNVKNCSKEYPDFSEILRGRQITLREC